MKSIFLFTTAIALSASSIGATSVMAGLGDAEVGTKRDFAAYCGEKGKDCTVTFTDSRIIVNKNDSISKDQFKKYIKDSSWRCGAFSCIGSGTYLVIYEEDGVEGSGSFIFTNRKAYNQFGITIEAFCGAKCHPVGPSIKIE